MSPRRVLGAALACTLAFASSARAAIDPVRGGATAHDWARTTPPAFCAGSGRPLRDDERRLCPLVDDGLACPAFAAACRDTKEAVAKAEPLPDTSPRGSALDAVAFFAFWGLVAALFVALAAYGARAFFESRRTPRLPSPRAPRAPAPQEAATRGPSDPRSLLREAETLERAGEYESALYTYLEAALHALDRQGAIRLARDRTNGEYVRACADGAARTPLRELVRAVERVKFGGAEPTVERTRDAHARAVRLVRGVAAALALALFFAPRGGDAMEPAPAGAATGMAVLSHVLAEQGVTTRPLRESLAQLTLPAPTDPHPPAVLVDLDRIHVDARARHHLEDWVRAGGTLVLLGHVDDWPATLGTQQGTAASRVVVASKPSVDGAEPDGVFLGAVAAPRAILGVQAPLASTGDGMAYAAWWHWDRGTVIGVASDDLFLDAGMLHRENAEIALSILVPMTSKTLFIADDLDGIDGPSSPAASLSRAGLDLGIWHALAAAVVLFGAFGARLARAKPTPPPMRRAYAEHIEATGLLYARAGASGHALSLFAKLVEERLRAALPRGVEPATFLAQQSGISVEDCARILARATSKTPAPSRADDLAALAELLHLHRALTSTMPENRPP